MERYKAFIEIHKKAHPSMKPTLQLQDGQKLWNEVKKDPEKYKQTMLELKTKASKSDSKKLGFWSAFGKKASNVQSSSSPRPSDVFSENKTSKENEQKVS